ncbi:hypothetical protein [Halorarius halobius]|uniref:hypothetical protein n=1 Tax=Halorarius halobius TaxID=2962671 RepID=UPI0020CC500D|nr:hypothetical protein [Halorarius halobius]
MTDGLRRYGAGAGIPLGAGIGATAAVVAGLSGELALVAGFGVVGGLLVGGLAGGYADENRGDDGWELRLLAVAVLFSLLVGGVLGALTAWTVDAAVPVGYAVGSAAGGLFGLLLSGVLLAAARSEESGGPAAA